MHLEFSTLDPIYFNSYLSMTYPFYRAFLQSLARENNQSVVAIGVQDSSIPIGLVLSKLSNNAAQLLSVFIAPKHRKQGIAKTLIQHLEAELVRRRCKSILAVYEKGREYTETIEKTLNLFGYLPCRVRALIGRADREAIIKAPWLQNRTVPDGFEISPWKDVTNLEKEAIKSSQKKETWYPEILTPFQDEDSIELISSLALRQTDRNNIVGWFISHRVTKDTIRFTAMFVRREFQKSGLGLPMLVESIQRLLHHQDPRLKTGLFMIQSTNKIMVNFARKRLAPYLSELHESVERSKYF